MVTLDTLAAYAAQPFPPDWPSDHLTFNAPDDNVLAAVQAVVRATDGPFVLAMYSFTEPGLVAAVVANVQAGLTGLIVLDSSEMADETQQRVLAPLLALRGHNLRLSVGTSEAGPGNIMHRKIYVAGSVVVSGSFNWTTAAASEDNQCTIGTWPADAARLRAQILETYAYQIAHCPQP